MQLKYDFCQFFSIFDQSQINFSMSKCEQCIVRQFNSLKHLTKDDLVRISNCKTSKIIKKGESIFEEGDYLNGVYCIKDGVCKVSKMSENGKNQIVNLVKRGDLLGERSLISEEVSNLNAIALEDMEVCFIPREEIIRDLEKNPAFTMDVLKNMATNLKNSDNLLVDMAQKSVKQRLAETLLKLQTKFGVNDLGAINLQLSREDIANIIGTATESCIRLLSEFKKSKYIDFDGKNIIIVNKNELEKIANGF
jgi:CRP-like cAMP-binding protein